MTRITESAIEQLAIERLEALGYRYVYAPDIAYDGDTPERTRQVEALFTVQRAISP